MSKLITWLLMPLLILLFADRVDCDSAVDLAVAARSQIGRTVLYDPGYYGLTYPNGDVPIERGVCADVVIRALRSAYGFDLQQRVHEDMKKEFHRYPRRWGLKRPDKNIDHRRVPNLQTFFKKKGWALGVSQRANDYRPGDIVTCTVPPHLPHIMIVSDQKNSRGIPLVIHNIGAGVQEENRLFEFELTGHYRMPSENLPALHGNSSGYE